MPRTYLRKTDRGTSYTKEKLLEAVTAVKNGTLSAYAASKTYGIPRPTIVNRVHDRFGLKSSTLGRDTVLSREVEEMLVQNLHTMEKYGFGLTRKELMETIGQFVVQNEIKNPFKNNVPGEDWFLTFKKRHGLSVKKPQPVEYARKTACNPTTIYVYFDLLEKTLEDLGLRDKPSQIWNVDETSFSKDPSKSKVVGLRGFTSTRTISSPGKDNTTVLLGCNAVGEKTPPLIVFKGKNVWDQWVSEDGYPGTVYAATANGWMEAPVFENFFEKVFLPTVGDKRPILLVYDGHATHVGINIIQKARESDITILKIPPHTSHLLQPLDLAVNKSVKDKWDIALVKWQRLNIGKILPKKDFSRILGQVWTEVDPQICAAGFRKAGICPLNHNAVPENKFDQVLLAAWKQKKDAPPEASSSKQQLNLVDHAHSESFQPKTLCSLAAAYICKTMPVEFHVVNVHAPPETFLPVSQHLDISLKHQEKNQQIETDRKNLQIESNSQSVQILSNNIVTSNVTFEELLLKSVKAATYKKTYRKKIATGAEVITHDEVYKRCKLEEDEKVQKLKRQEERKKIRKEKSDKSKKGVKALKIKKELVSSSESEIEMVIDDESDVDYEQYLENIMKLEEDEKAPKLKRQEERKKIRKERSGKNKKEEKSGKNKKGAKALKIKKELVSSSESEIEMVIDDESDVDYEQYLENIMKLEEDEKAPKLKRQEERKKIRKERSGKNKKEEKSGKKKKGAKALKKKKELVSSSESEIEMILDDESDVDYEQYLKNVMNENENSDDNKMSESEEIKETSRKTSFAPNDWVLVKFATKKTIKYFVGIVTDNADIGHNPIVKYARKKASKVEGVTVFTFPIVDDVLEVRHVEDIVTKLPNPENGRRGQFIFKMSFDMYNIQ